MIPLRWDLFCRVIDNYGDAGVAWRLARQLHADFGVTPRLFIDDLSALARMVPECNPLIDFQEVAGVLVRRWGHPFVVDATSPVVIETFGCEAPRPYVEAMANSPDRVAWINLEYLSAEDWVTGCHRLPSPHGSYPLVRHFFFPGFFPGTGGLIRESGLLERRQVFQDSVQAQEQFWQSLNLLFPAPDELVISLFGYDTVQLHDLLNDWISGPRPVRCLLPENTPLAARAAVHLQAPFGTRKATKGSLTCCWIPFFSQERYDEVLWVCDFNFVRGEDSFVRAQWAARPLAWHIYPQSERAHLIKMEAFLAAYCQGLSSEAGNALRKFFMAWNGDGDVQHSWRAMEGHLDGLRAHARHWAEQLARQVDLAHQLAGFVSRLL